jgi:glutamate receptor, ionotropic, invertebrate
MLNSRFEFGVEDNSYNRYYFKVGGNNVVFSSNILLTVNFQAETESVRKQIYDTKIAPSDNFMNTTVGLEKIRKGLFAFHTETGPAYKIIEDTFYEQEKCGLTEIKFIQVSQVCLALQKKSPYKEMLKVKYVLARVAELAKVTIYFYFQYFKIT